MMCTVLCCSAASCQLWMGGSKCGYSTVVLTFISF